MLIDLMLRTPIGPRRLWENSLVTNKIVHFFETECTDDFIMLYFGRAYDIQREVTVN